MVYDLRGEIVLICCCTVDENDGDGGNLTSELHTSHCRMQNSDCEKKDAALNEANEESSNSDQWRSVNKFTENV